MWSWGISCRAGHPNCRIPWGYDKAHTDSPRPYALEELAARTEAPHRYAYPTVEEYEFAFRLWRSLRRDARPTPAEEEGARRWRLTKLAERLGVPELLDHL